MMIPFPRADIYKPIQERFISVANTVGGSPAIVSKDQTVTYTQLLDLSKAIAADLRKYPPTEIVTILSDGGAALFAAIFAVLQHGAAFVTIPIRSTKDEQKRIWERCGKPVIITTDEYLELARAICPDEGILVVDASRFENAPLAYQSGAQDLSIATLMFTSGSTGEPKGVINSHKMVLHAALVNQELYNFNTSDRVAMFSSFGFGAALTASFAVLLSGAALYIPSYSSIAELIAWIRNEKISVLSQIPANLFRQIFAELAIHQQTLPCRGLLTGGSQIYTDDIRAFRKTFPNAEIFDHRFAGSEFMLLYHTLITPRTELTTSNELIPFSMAVPDKTIKLIDENGDQVSKGDSGEIVITSEFISSGYWQAPELTNKHFTGPNADGVYSYRSGDIARFDKHGNFEFLGRSDRRVKLRGFTIYLDTISNTLKKHPRVIDAFVILRTSDRSQRLVGYYQSAEELSAAELRLLLMDELPAYMVPAYFIHVQEFPRTQTGKIISDELTECVFTRPNLDHEVIPPDNALEKAVISVFEKILETKGVGVTDEFFDLGGDSLSYLSMVTELEKLGFSRKHLSPTGALTARDIINNRDVGNNTKEYRIQAQKTKKRRISPRHLFSREYYITWLRFIEGVYIDLLTAPFRNLDHFEAHHQIMNAAKTWFWRRILFGYKRRSFFRWLRFYSPDHPDPETAFSISIFNRMVSFFSTYLRVNGTKTKNLLEMYKINPLGYWRSFYDHIINTPAEEIIAKFTFSGTAYLEEAYSTGKGVILLSHHGEPRVPYFFALEKHLGLETIPVISYKIPLANNSNALKSITQTNAEILIQGFETLSRGQIIKIFPDTDDKTGELHAVNLLKHRTMIKAGFVELALRSGAPIIPTNMTIDPSGAITMNFYPPLTINGANHTEQVAHLLEQYAAFVNRSFSNSPGSIVWKKYEDLDKIHVNK